MTIEQQILAALKTKYSSLGLGDKILAGFALSMSKTVKEEKEIEAAVAGAEDQLKIYQSIIDAHNTKVTGLQKEIEELKKSKSTDKTDDKTDDKKKSDDKTDDKTTDQSKDVPDYVKAILDKLDKTEAALTAIQSEKVKGANREKLIAKLKEQGVSEHFYKTQLKDEFENEEALTAYALSLKEAEISFIQSLTDKKVLEQPQPIFGKPKDEKNGVSPDVQAFIDSKKPPEQKTN